MCVCLESIEKSGKTPEENGTEEKGENTRFFSICIPLYSSSSFVLSGRYPFLLQVRLPALPAQAPRRRRRGTAATMWWLGSQAWTGRFQLSEAPPWHSLEERHDGYFDRCLPARTRH